MANSTGMLTVTVDGKDYRLWLGFSGLANLQEKHGSEFISRLDAPDDAPEGWLPDFAILRDMLLEALERFHADEADRWLVDEIWAASPDVVGKLLAASFPDQVQSGGASGNAKRTAKRAS